MTKPKHTPGPWVVAGFDDFSRLPIEAATEYCVALVDLSHAQDANALLIAAAPDLLEALELWRDRISGPTDISMQTLLHMTDAAIAKAKGEE